jgi:predicted component of viral defense system (DUF524 family)
MRRDYKAYSGVQFLLTKYRNIFGRTEKRKYYLGEDFRAPERRFLKFALEQRRIELEEELYQRQTIN